MVINCQMTRLIWLHAMLFCGITILIGCSDRVEEVSPLGTWEAISGDVLNENENILDSQDNKKLVGKLMKATISISEKQLLLRQAMVTWDGSSRIGSFKILPNGKLKVEIRQSDGTVFIVICRKT